jgi:hypothetical protein
MSEEISEICDKSRNVCLENLIANDHGCDFVSLKSLINAKNVAELVMSERELLFSNVIQKILRK